MTEKVQKRATKLIIEGAGPKARSAAAIVKSLVCAYYLYVLYVVAAATSV